MNNKKSTRRALLSSVLSLILCVTMLIGTTFAWFTDSVTSGRNTIQSGNLDVELYYATTAADVAADEWTAVGSNTKIFDNDLWEPGFTKVAYFKVVNNGSLALKYKLSADVYAETAGVNKAGETFLLSDYIKTAVIDTTATRDSILAMDGVEIKNSVAMSANSLAAKGSENDSKVIGLAIWMPTTVGNEANHNGTNVPSIEFGINLIATQDTVENDSFGTDYDKDATYPLVAWGSKPVDEKATTYEIPLMKANGGKAGSATIEVASVADGAENLSVIVKETTLDKTVKVESDQEAKTYDIKVTGLKEGNTTPVTVVLNVGTGLTGVKLFHKNVEVTNAVYNAVKGVITFKSASFSPYTITYDRVAVDAEVEMPDTAVPVAEVSNAAEYENQSIAWTGWGGYNPGNKQQQLESVYLFKSPHTSEKVDECFYKNWYCDYYVKLVSDKIDTLPAGSISLGGNYGGYGWVGFDNPEVATNTSIPLLGSVMNPDGEPGADSGWTYADVVTFVDKFWCGVGRTASGMANEALNGAKFVVELRITNPENESEYINVNTVTYTFGTKESVIENYTPSN